MNSVNETILADEHLPRVQFVSKDGETSLYTLHTLPCFSLQDFESKAIIIPVLPFASFNSVSVDTLKEIKVGDKIQVTADIDHQLYKSWNPPTNFTPVKDQVNTYTVSLIVEDALGYPIIMGKEES